MIRPISDNGAGTNVKGQAAVGATNMGDTMCHRALLRALHRHELPGCCEAAARKGLTLNAEQLRGVSRVFTLRSAVC